MDPVADSADGPVLRVRVRPRARRDAVVGVDERGIIVAVRAAPEHGKANAAVCRVVGRWLGGAPSSVSIEGGAGARDKRVLVRGVGVEEVRARVRALGDAREPRRTPGET